MENKAFLDKIDYSPISYPINYKFIKKIDFEEKLIKYVNNASVKTKKYLVSPPYRTISKII